MIQPVGLPGEFTKIALVRSLANANSRSRSSRHSPSTSSTEACRSEEHTSELQSLMRISYAVFCLKKKKNKTSKESNTIVLSITTHLHKSLHSDIRNTPQKQ